MLSARLIKKLEGIEKCSRQGHKVRNLFNLMTHNPEVWLQAYANLYPTKERLPKGQMTPQWMGFAKIEW
jgi:hypothetical protein